MQLLLCSMAQSYLYHEHMAYHIQLYFTQRNLRMDLRLGRAGCECSLLGSHSSQFSWAAGNFHALGAIVSKLFVSIAYR